MENLNPRQQQFVREYLIDFNASAAAARSGYKQPRVQGPRLLLNVAVQQAVAALVAERARATQITADRVLQEIAAVAFSDLGDLVEFTEDGIRFRPEVDIPEAARRSLSSVKVQHNAGSETRQAATVVEFKLWPKVQALQQLAQHLGLLKLHHEHTGKDGGPIEYANLTDDEITQRLAAAEARIAQTAGSPGGGAAPVEPVPGEAAGSGVQPSG